MMWKSFFRVQNFFSAFLNVPIVFDRDSETFQVTPCNTLWRKIKRFLLTNLCLFVIWGISIYRLLHQLLTSVRDENFTVLDVVIISIALAFCTEGLAHIWTFHFSAGDICYILTQSLRLTKLHCYMPQQMQAWTRKFSTVSTTGSTVNGGFSNFSTKFPLLRLQQLQPDFSLKSLLQWENQVLSLKHTFLSSRFNLSKEEFIMYSIAVGFNGVPLVCFLAPLMTSSDPASFLMKRLIFRKSPIIAMLAAAFFQGLTAFYTSLLSLNLVLICLTIVCEMSAVMRTSYPAAEKVKSTKRTGATAKPTDKSRVGGGGSCDGENSAKNGPSANNKSESNGNVVVVTGISSTERKVENAKNLLGESSKPSFIQPEIRIDNYDESNVFTIKSGSAKMEKEAQNQVSHLENHSQQQKQQQQKSHCSPRQEENSELLNFQSKKPDSTLQEQTSVFQVLSPKLDNQPQVPPPPPSFSFPLHPTFGSASTTCVMSSGENRHSASTNSNGSGNSSSSVSPTATTTLSTSSLSTSSPSTNLSAPSSPMLMMKIIEELGPTVTEKPETSSLVKKLMCPTPIQRIKSSAEVLFLKSFQLYLQTKLLVLFINDSMFYYFPVVISVGMVLSTLSAYATIKLHSFLPLPLRLSILLIGVTIATVMLLLMIEAAEITRHSDEFLRYWRNRLKRKFSRKQLRTCSSLCFKIGPFVDFKKDTIFGVFSTVQHYTVNMAVIQLVP